MTIEKNSTMNPESVCRLNVGGTKFITSRETLLKSSFMESYMKNWSSNASSDDKTIYLDVDGKIFRYVLEYLRGDLQLDDVPYKIIHRFLRMLEYFCINYSFPTYIKVNKEPFGPYHTMPINAYRYADEGDLHFKKGDRIVGIKIFPIKHIPSDFGFPTAYRRTDPKPIIKLTSCNSPGNNHTILDKDNLFFGKEDYIYIKMNLEFIRDDIVRFLVDGISMGLIDYIN